MYQIANRNFTEAPKKSTVFPFANYNTAIAVPSRMFQASPGVPSPATDADAALTRVGNNRAAFNINYAQADINIKGLKY